jgi:aspartate kinase
MIVLKFGGTSVGDATRIRTVFSIVSERLQRRPVVVVSAFSGVTDRLFQLARDAVKSKQDLSWLQERHLAVIRDLDVARDLVDPFLSELSDWLRGVALVGELTPRSLDAVASFGERMSSAIIAAYFTKRGLPACAVAAYDIGLLTDSRYGRAKPLADIDPVLAERCGKIAEVPIVTGYIAKDKEGNATTLGRNGSDYTAAILGRALRAEEIQIWTDVDGVMTGDPRLVPEAVPLREMTFDEAAELAYYGASVLHPSTIEPATECNIPVRVLNTHDPQSPGTLIVGTIARKAPVVRAIVHKEDVTLVNIVSTKMLMDHGFMARVFDACARYEVVLDLIATTEVSVSVTTDDDKNLAALVRELGQFSKVSVEKDLAVVSVVGHGIKGAVWVAGKIFGTLSDLSLDVRMISMGALRNNVQFLVRNEDVPRTVQCLHAVLFQTAKSTRGETPCDASCS